MPHYGTLRDYHFTDVDEATDDIRGAKVYGVDDEKLGKIDDVIFDHSTGDIRYVVVDTGGWLSSKKFIVPPYQLTPSVQHEDDFQVHLTKEQIETFPPYNESDIESDEKWNDYEGRYRSKWEADPIMHRVATDRNITPTTKQQIDAGSGSLASDDLEEDETVSDVTPMRTEASLGVDPSGPSRRWDTFEDRLRQRRQEIVSVCSACKATPTSEAAAEREKDARRKAS
ncbi:MAG TPA: PRC-barrel domain-containing protein [Terriglobales bacterium]|jgi:sporulation protein YlmC with PRC-barrel domain|nr:PRC-barrel domain-containing protein [Terriglobales bacterium]